MTATRRTPVVHLAPERVAALVADAVPGARVTGVALLTGGAANTGYRVELAPPYPACVLRLYVRSAGACAKELALFRLVGSAVPVPRVLGRGRAAIGGAEIPFALLELVRGRTLDAIVAGPRTGDPPLSTAGEALGRVLARLGSFGFDRAGDLVAEGPDERLHVRRWDFDGGDALGFFRHTLFATPAGRRLGAALRDRLWRVAEEGAARWPEMGHECRLVHGDFGPANVVLAADDRSWRVQAVLDWEFAHAGVTLIDAGNLLRVRPESPLPPDFARALRRGLEEAGAVLPADWRSRAEYLDLLSACEFLSSEEERPDVHARATAQIEATLDRWDARL